MDIFTYFHSDQWLLLPIIPLITYLLNRTLSKLELLLLCGALLVIISPIVFGYQIRFLWVEFLMYLAFSAVMIGLLFRKLSRKHKGFLGFLSVILLTLTFIAIFFSSFGATTTVVSSYQKDGYLYQKKYVQGFAGKPVTYLQQNETFLFGFYINPVKRIYPKSSKKDKNEHQNDSPLVSSKNQNLDTLYYIDCDTANIQNVFFKACVKRPGSFTLSKNDSVLIYESKENPSHFGFEDVNKDSYKDLLFGFVSNTPGINSLLLYDAKTKDFDKVEEFENFPDAKKITGTNFYYSYHKSGCADANWDSDLFKIVNNKATRFGNLHAVGCGSEDVQPHIEVYKVSNNKKILVKTIDSIPDNKYDFIKSYWTTKYQQYK